MQHMIKKEENKQEVGEAEKKPGDDLPEEMQDERYKNLDPVMVETIENEIMER